MTAADLKTAWRQYHASALAKMEPGKLEIAVTGSMTAQPLEPFLGANLVARGLSPAIQFGPFNQVRQVCRDHEAVLGAEPDAIVLLWRLEDMYLDVLSRGLDDAGALDELFRDVRELARDVFDLRRRFRGILIVSNPPFPSTPLFDLRDITRAGTAMEIFRAVSSLWRAEITRIEGVRQLDLEALLIHAGARHAHDSRTWLLYRQPYTEAFWCDIGEALARLIAAEKRSGKKCIVVDLDNTLWGGVIGDDGLEGIQLGDDFPGKAYRDFQRHLLALKKRGIVLAVASRNHPDQVYEVFERHDAMILARTDFAVFEIHWESKVDSIRRIAEKLNLGLDALVFVDDNAKETGEVRERLPQVTCILVPEELADLPALLAGTDLFDSHAITDEDRRRTEMMVADQQRVKSREIMSEQDFLRSLDLGVNVFAAARQHINRITQLINKTNQFNLTTIRRTQREVEELVSMPDTLVLGMDVHDRYGDYGLVGVAILRKRNLTCSIDTLLMSCRVLGRGVEDAFVASLAHGARTLACTKLRGRYVSTPRNGLVKDLYSRLGFVQDAGSEEWIASLQAVPPAPGHVQLRESFERVSGGVRSV
jgi:FkbH-like protein